MKRFSVAVLVLLSVLTACTQYVFVPFPIKPGDDSSVEIAASDAVSNFGLADIVTALAAGEQIDGIVPSSSSIVSSLPSRAAGDTTLKTIAANVIDYTSGEFVYNGTLSVNYIGANSSISSFTADLNVTVASIRGSDSVQMVGSNIPGTIEATINGTGEIDVTVDAVLSMSGASVITVDGEEIQANGSTGNGTSEATAYTFTTADQLLSFAVAVNSGELETDGMYFALGEDIDLDGREWTPIGLSTRSSAALSEDSRPFCGTFDGHEHTISDFVLESEEEDLGLGFFSALDGATVRNLVLRGTLTSSSNSSAGMVAGISVNDSVISGCIVEEGSSITAAEAGGIVGRMMKSGIIENSVNYADITASGKVGGIVSAAYYDQRPNAESGETYTPFKVENCINYGTLQGGTGNLGGIVGLAGPVDVISCTNNGDINGGNAVSVGGIIGEMRAGASISDSINYGDITLSGRSENAYGVGGLAGWIRYLNDGNNTYNYYRICSVSGSENHGNVTTDGGTGIGGAVGMIYNAATISDSVNTGVVKLTEENGLMIGGFIGSLQSEKDANDLISVRNTILVTSCSSTGSVECPENTTSHGTFVGHPNAPTDEMPITVKFTDCTPSGEGSGIINFENGVIVTE